jgi:hypothetical protein
MGFKKWREEIADPEIMSKSRLAKVYKFQARKQGIEVGSRKP